MHKPEFIQDNETHEKSKKRKENLPNYGLFHPGRQLSEHQRKQKARQVLLPCQRTKKAVEHENESNTSHNWCT